MIAQTVRRVGHWMLGRVTGDEVAALIRDRLRVEIQNLVKLVAKSVKDTSVASEIRQYEADIERIEQRLKVARPAPPTLHILRPEYRLFLPAA